MVFCPVFMMLDVQAGLEKKKYSSFLVRNLQTRQKLSFLSNLSKLLSLWKRKHLRKLGCYSNHASFFTIFTRIWDLRWGTVKKDSDSYVAFLYVPLLRNKTVTTWKDFSYRVSTACRNADLGNEAPTVTSREWAYCCCCSSSESDLTYWW